MSEFKGSIKLTGERLTIFLDESGCLGNKKGSSKVFILTALVCQDQLIVNAIEKAASRTLKNKHKNKSGVHRELKGTSTSPVVKRYFFRFLPCEGWALFTVVLNKNIRLSVVHKKSIKEDMHSSLAQFLLQQIIHQIKFSENLKSVHIVFDKCKSATDN